jgi:hypothetical protein
MDGSVQIAKEHGKDVLFRPIDRASSSKWLTQNPPPIVKKKKK